MTGWGVSVLICLGSEPYANDKSTEPLVFTLSAKGSTLGALQEASSRQERHRGQVHTSQSSAQAPITLLSSFTILV